MATIGREELESFTPMEWRLLVHERLNKVERGLQFMLGALIFLAAIVGAIIVQSLESWRWMAENIKG